MATLHNHDPVQWSHHPLEFPRHFFLAWSARNAYLQDRWREESVFKDQHVTKQTFHFSSLQKKIQQLKDEIVSLIAQDTALFHQLFRLQDAMLEYREACIYDLDDSSSDVSTSSSSSCSDGDGVIRNSQSNSFVRHRKSYPPTARNRSRRAFSFLTSRPASAAGCKDSYDSGIHTPSDLEIFV